MNADARKSPALLQSPGPEQGASPILGLLREIKDEMTRTRQAMEFLTAMAEKVAEDDGQMDTDPETDLAGRPIKRSV